MIRRTVDEAIFQWLKVSGTDSLRETVSGWDAGDWHEALFQIRLHGLGPLLFSRLSGLPEWNDLSGELTDHLAREYENNGKRIQKIIMLRDRLYAEMDLAGIPVYPLKGSILIDFYYDDSALRPMADIDLLVSPEHRERCVHVLKNTGWHLVRMMERHRVFRCNEPEAVITDVEHPDNPIDVELHDSVHFRCIAIDNLRFDITRRLLNAAHGNVSGYKDIRIMDETALLFHLLCHFSHHMYMGSPRFLHLLDIAKVARHFRREQWEELQEWVEVDGLHRLVYPGLAMVKRYCDLEIPVDLFRETAAGCPRSLVRSLSRYPLNRYTVDSESRVMKTDAKRKKNIGDLLWMFLHRLLMKHAVFFHQNIIWAYPGRERRRGWFRFLIPGMRELRILYPTWLKRFPAPIVYGLHFVTLSLLPVQAMAGLSSRRARVDRFIRRWRFGHPHE